jgi:hypothetical protein
MTRRHKILTAIAALHLVLVVCGAVHWPVLPAYSEAGQAVAVVRNYTGSDSSYGFFAPGVSSQIRVRFTLFARDGQQWADELDKGMTQEARLRISSGLHAIMDDPGRLGDLAPSWAATIFGRHGAAKKVIAIVEYFDVPTMEEYAAGQRPHWVAVYRQEFTRK